MALTERPTYALYARRIPGVAAAFGDSPVAFRRPLQQYLANSVESLPGVGPRLEAPSFDPHLSFVFRESGGTVSAITMHIDDILDCGEPDMMLKAQCFSEKRFGKLESRRSPARTWHGSGPGERFLGDGSPGGLYEQPQIAPHAPGVAGRPEGAVVVG